MTYSNACNYGFFVIPIRTLLIDIHYRKITESILGTFYTRSRTSYARFRSHNKPVNPDYDFGFVDHRVKLDAMIARTTAVSKRKTKKNEPV